jgi:hypothetical protein
MPPNEECPNCHRMVADWHVEWSGDREMSLLTLQEKSFLDVFLHEATTAPFTGPATRALHKTGVEYGDISYIAWAYEQDVPRNGFAIGHAAGVAPPVPWPNRESVLRRNQEIRRIWEQRQQGGGGPSGHNAWERQGAVVDIRPEPDAADRPGE